MLRRRARGLIGALVLVASGGAGLAAPLDDQLRAAVAAGELPGLHAAVIDLGEDRLAEIYVPGEDERWGTPLGMRSHGPETLHDLRSVTKSVVGLLYGIALSEGLVPAPDRPLLAQFPDLVDLRDGSDRELITVGDALSMRMGTQWNEDLPYSDPANSEIAMENSPDRYRFALSRPMIDEPGTVWRYNGGAVALIGRLIADGSGMTLEDFARTRLFDPLGITEWEWVAGRDGIASAASGLRLTAPDLARIGAMLAQGGMHEGQRIVPAEWLDESRMPRAALPDGIGYGYLWYVAGPAGRQVMIAVGNGGQRLSVQPEAGLVVVSFAGRYNDPLSWQTSLKVVLDIAVPEAQRRLGR